MLYELLTVVTHRFGVQHNGYEAEQRKACCAEASIRCEGGDLHVQSW
jgi:hypothetical protein